MELHVWQHVYSQAPAELSPQRQAGYQTLFVSQPGLHPEDLQKLEAYAQYHPGETAPAVYRFFLLTEGKAAVMRITPLAEMDSSGLHRRYLAHSFILSSAGLKALEYCPLALLEPANFFQSLTQVYQQGDRTNGSLPIRHVQPRLDWQSLAQQYARRWPPAELAQLARLGWQAAEQAGQPTGSQGETGPLLAALSIVYLLTPPAKRAHLTFDTWAVGCDWAQRGNPFWLWGGCMAHAQSPIAYIEAGGMRVHVPTHLASEASPPDMPFGRWVLNCAIPQQLQTYTQDRDDALLLEAAVLGQSTGLTRLDQIAPRLRQDFLQANAPLIAQSIVQQLPADLSSGLRQQLTQAVLQKPWEYLLWLQNGLEPCNLAEMVYQNALNGSRTPSPSDCQSLTELANAAQHSALRALLHLFRHDQHGWMRELPAISPQEYGELLATALKRKLADPADLLYPNYLHIWCQHSARWLNAESLKTALAHLEKYRGEWEADTLVALTDELPRPALLELTRWAHHYPGRAMRLRAQLKPHEKEALSSLDKFSDLLFGPPAKADEPPHD